MKNFFIIVCLSLFVTSQLKSSDIVRIEVGSKPTDNVRDLQIRVWELERAVRQLQNKVFNLRDNPVPITTVTTVTEKVYSCYLHTSFNGTFLGKGATLTEAKGKALKACADGTNKSGKIYCDEKDLKCD